MLKQQAVILESIYNLGKLINPDLGLRDVENLLLDTHKGEVELGHNDFNFTGKLLMATDVLHKTPKVTLSELDNAVHTRECHIDSAFMFSEDGRVYDEFLAGYIHPESVNGEDTVQVTLNRTVINMPLNFVRYYATAEDTKKANERLDEALSTIRSSTMRDESKRKEEERKERLHKERESQSERYLFHTKTKGMRLAGTPYILTEEGRVFDTEIGRLRAVNNKGYTTNLTKGFTIPMNLSINNIKNMFNNQDFKALIERAGYTEYQCNTMWDEYQKTLQNKEEKDTSEVTQTKTQTLDEIALQQGFIKTEDGYIHKDFV